MLQGADVELPERLQVSEMHRHDVAATWGQINTLHHLNKLTQAETYCTSPWAHRGNSNVEMLNSYGAFVICGQEFDPLTRTGQS